MFICNACLRKNYTNGESLFKSGGRCEDCGESAVCNEIQSSRLNPRMKPVGIDPSTGLPKPGYALDVTDGIIKLK